MSERNIYVFLSGRCGNQLFQYAFARAFQLRYGGKLIFDYTQGPYNNNDGESYHRDLYDLNNLADCSFIERKSFDASIFSKFQLRVFSFVNKLYNHIGWKYPKASDLLKYVLSRILAWPLQLFFGIYHIESPNSSWLVLPPLFHKTIIIRGYFESAKYFDKYDYIIKNELALNIDHIPLKNVLESKETICMSIRRGDFLSDRFKGRYLVCTEQYYKSAIDYVRSKHPNCQLLICSDDIEWCKKNLDFGIAEVFYEPRGLRPIETLQLMSRCNHFVMSNSTFSWWAQHLCINPNKIVIAPKRWRNGLIQPKDIYETNWTKL